jgi:hypothetical protein
MLAADLSLVLWSALKECSSWKSLKIKDGKQACAGFTNDYAASDKVWAWYSFIVIKIDCSKFVF